MFSTTTFITLALSAAVVVAIDSGPALLSCAEVDCPTGGGNVTSANCQVADRNLSAIGLATFEVSLTTNNSVTFTWTQGLETYDDVNPDVDLDRIYEKNFYLGSPQGVDLRANATNSPGLGACALFFTTVTDQVAFDGEDRRVSTGTCTDALDAGCVDAILAQARDVTASLDRQSSADACERLLSAFREGVASQCAQFAGSDGWEGLEVRGMYLCSAMSEADHLRCGAHTPSHHPPQEMTTQRGESGTRADADFRITAMKISLAPTQSDLSPERRTRLPTVIRPSPRRISSLGLRHSTTPAP